MLDIVYRALMEKSIWEVLALLSLLTFLLFHKITKNQRPKPNSPPGPKPWPVIGNLNLLGPIPHQSLHELSKKHGQIMLLKFGKFPVVVASSPEMAKQFLRVHDSVFVSRPALAAGKHIGFNYSNMAWAPYGPHWKQARRIYFSEVFNARALEFFEQIRVGERKRFLSRLHSLSGKPVVIRDELLRLTLTTISRMVLSDRYFGTESGNVGPIIEVDELQEMLDEWFLLSGAINVGDWIPWLRFFDLQGYVRRMKDLNKKMNRFLEYVIADHEASRRAAPEKDQFAAEDVVDMLLQLSENPDNLEVQLTRDCIKGLIQDLLLGGNDTSATTVEWAIHEILRQPRIIEKAKEELDRVIGRNRWVEEDDFSRLPYIEAIIMETFRLHPLTTFLVPHYSMEDCNVAGYDVLKGTMILVNTWSIGRDPSSWDAPEAFLPERFMGKETDMIGNNFALLPFGSGRRRCPGYNLALKIVRTTLANLVQGFEMKLVEGMKAEDICMEEVYGLTTHPKLPLSIVMEPTLSPGLYR